MDLLGISVPMWCLLVLLCLVVLYVYGTSTFGIFDRLNVPGPKPWPMVGNIVPILRMGLPKYHRMIHEKFGKTVGIFVGRRPMLVVFDPEILKHVLVKEFPKFRNRYRPDIREYPTAKMLTLLEDDHWKHVRNHLSPTFSGSKLRRMVQLINRCCTTMVANLQEPVRAGDMFECSEYSRSYAMDVIASTAFSIDIDAKQDRNNKFVLMVNKMLNVSPYRLVTLVFIFAPFLLPHLKKLGLSFFQKDVLDFLVDIVDKTIKDRQDNPDQTPKDFIQMMISSQVEDLTEKDAENDETGQAMVGSSGVWSKLGLTHEEVLAQSLIFFLAGFFTSSAAISFTMYNLATNPSCQEKVYQEIMDVVGSNDADPDYDDMKKMTYLEMCIEETLRQYPPAPRTDRFASEDVDVGGLHIPAGITVGIPIYALHHDPKAWPEPDKFDPERFTPEEKAKRHPFQYIPFGMGPRNCVGMRLAVLEIKMALLHILRNFKLVPCEKTDIPLKLKKLLMEAEKGIWIKAEARV